MTAAGLNESVAQLLSQPRQAGISTGLPPNGYLQTQLCAAAPGLQCLQAAQHMLVRLVQRSALLVWAAVCMCRWLSTVGARCSLVKDVTTVTALHASTSSTLERKPARSSSLIVLAATGFALGNIRAGLASRARPPWPAIRTSRVLTSTSACDCTIPLCALLPESTSRLAE